MGVTIAVRHYLSGEHLEAAALFARNCSAIEKSSSAGVSDDLRSQHRGYVLGAVTSSVAGIEATINELFADAVDRPTGNIARLGPDAIAAMASMWDLGAERLRPLEKYQVALVLNRKPKMDRGAAPYQDAWLLIQLRNDLVHYKPEWVIGVSPTPVEHQWERRLSGKFTLNPFTGAGNPFYPDKCLGHGCAKWSVLSSIAIINGLHDELGLPAPYNPLPPRLRPE
jgi:hypothetical protein